ncbi:hypothetical protein A3F29_01900 [Candidatus Roizmanbacteria bacterium RIFCSPHIGHO2_12_FULL_33_9]|uniref:Uncharacterized protein n=1 Tax=Candidatus Roizmanbacteria bacterium RIFCSPHIGHO2_12_FULL_33_9 TaxID=1802045 RepID=A0A1F7HFM3_9BACT|nr:MAG: hypothetical protein A3F29_01900 [Candidatus Roizmanbacteria bacterium RIFCSPHIGHO2_12_FULL_33_9]
MRSKLLSTLSIKKLSIRYIHILLLLCLIFFITASHILYVLKTYQYPQWDENVYLQYAVDYLPILKNPSPFFWGDILEITKHRQPFYPLFISIPLLFFGTAHAYKIALLMNGIFYAISILFTYLLARQFFGRLPSFLASYMFAFYGFPLFYLHFALQETTVTAFTTAALFFLAKSVKSSTRRNTVLFSLAAGIGTLVRWAVPIFLIGPFLSIILRIPKSEVFKHIIIIFFVGILPVVLLYYYPNLSHFLGYAEANRVGGSQWAPDPIKNPFSKSSLIWYASALAQQTIFFWVLFIAGFLLSLVHYKKYIFLLLAFIIPYLFLTFGSAWKDDRFIVPLYPTMALMSTVVIQKLHKKKFKIMVIILILLLGFLNFLGASWGIGPMKFSIHGNRYTVPHSIIVPMPIGHPRRVWLAPISWPPRSNEGNSDLILKTVLEDNKNNKKPNVLLTFTIPQIEGPLYKIVLYEQRDLINLRALWGFEANDLPTLFERIKNADYILIKEGGAFDDQFDDQPDLLQTFNETIKNRGLKLPHGFTKIETVEIPFDNSKVVIYKKTREITKEEWEIFANSFISEDKNQANPFK